MKNQIILLLITICVASCYSSKKIAQVDRDVIQCLKIDPSNYHNVMINPAWISKNYISRIIEREYLDGKNGKIHLVTILDYNERGYLITEYRGLSYPKDESPNETDIFSRWDYNQEQINSFVIQTAQIVRFHDRKGKRETPDTLKMAGKLFNLQMKNEFVNDEGEIIWTYKYDNQNRPLTKLNKDGEESFSIVYHSERKIEIKEYSSWTKEHYSSWMTIDKNGRITKDYNESNLSTHEFEYDKNGNMVVDKHWFKGKEPNYHTYEYIKRDSR